jgi:phospholipid/cholesterol/gamma-HCH transport system ATP-binding protein
MTESVIAVKNLTLAYGDLLIQRDLNFSVNRGDIFVIMGGSGCGKSTLLMHLIGLLQPARGSVFYGRQDFWRADGKTRETLMRKIGVLFQSGALLSSLTLAENIALPLARFTSLAQRQIDSVVSYKLALVGLAGFEDYYPAEISGGMQKRAGLARAMALDPEILFFDEPSAGLDPVSAKLLDDLIKSLRDGLGATVVMVTHELSSIFAIGTESIFLDPETKTAIASGPPRRLLGESRDPKVLRFLTRDHSAPEVLA